MDSLLVKRDLPISVIHTDSGNHRLAVRTSIFSQTIIVITIFINIPPIFSV